MPRDCFVIMPFSASTSCTEDQWTWIFEHLLRDSVEGVGLDYICRRSVATRGNIVGAILEDLNNAHVVLADLTDRNANVFYELGVRHALKDRTILIAQRKEDIPFDLQAYAYHVYGWRTDEERNALREKIRQLLAEIDGNPVRPDNPVSDFLKVHRGAEGAVTPVTVAASDVTIAQPLAGPGSEGVAVKTLVKRLVERNRPQDANTIFRLTKAELTPAITEVLKALNAKGKGGGVSRDKIYPQAIEYVTLVEPITRAIETFGLECAQEGWKAGLDVVLRSAGLLISITERPEPGSVIKYAQGTPALMAWRMLSLCGAKALDDNQLDVVRHILTEPIEVEEASGRFSNRPFLERRDLFYPEAFLGYADIAMQYVIELWNRDKCLHPYFVSNDDYQLAIAKFFILVALAAKPDDRGHAIYPGYRLLPEAGRAMSALTSRMFSSENFLAEIAGAIGETAANLKGTWSARVKPINELGERQWRPFVSDVQFPAKFGEHA